LNLYKKTKLVDSGPVYDLFSSPSATLGNELSSTALWWLSSMWWDIEGEFFWWFGGKSGFPTEISVLSPRRVEYEAYTKSWFFNNDDGQRIPMRDDEFIHVFEPNIWNPNRGVPPVAALAMELEQDWSVNRETLKRLNDSAIPQGILKTEQRITPVQARELVDMWEQKYGRSKGDKRIAVIGQGTNFQALNENLIQYFDVSDRNKVSILTKYGIPLKVANATTEKTALSGKDSNEQYKALWSQTLIPLHAFWEGELKTKFFNRYGLLNMRAEFDHTVIPELQEDEADLHKRLVADIQGSLFTPNEARELVHYPPVDGGDELVKAKEKEDVPENKGDDKKSFRGGAVSVFSGQLHKEGEPEGRDSGLSRLFGLLREEG
jgi:HK97 family phage portal protein